MWLGFSVAARHRHVIVVHCVEQILECRSLVRRLVPTHEHNVVQLASTVGRLRVSDAILEVLEYLRMRLAYTVTVTETMIDTSHSL